MGRAERWMLTAAALIAAPCAFAQAAMQFDVAAIRRHEPLPHERSHIVSSDKSGEFKTVNVTLIDIVQYAFAIPKSRIMDAPGWMKAERFDIEAKSDENVDTQLKAMDWDHAKPAKRAMIQALLEDRFGLKVHRETRELPVYEMVVAKSGSKLAAARSDGLTINHSSNRLNAQGMTTAGLAQEIAQDAGRPVLDKTGIDGRFDIDVAWTPADATGADASGPSLFTAMEEQLGLKLMAAKGPVEVLVVDAVSEPSAN